jgi:hypothetical protein
MVRLLTPEERELERKRAELAALEGELAECELELVTLHNELRAFEAHYLRTVGMLYAELDDLEAQIAETQARQEPEDRRVREQAVQARAKASESAHAVGMVLEETVEDHFRGDALKKLYRDIARQVHPDLATDDASRSRRTRLMAEANKAYTSGNEAALKAILDEWYSSPEAVEGMGVAADLVRTIRMIHQAQGRIEFIQSEVAALNGSELSLLRERAETEQMSGRDLLAQMAEQLNMDILHARRRRDGLMSHEAYS